MTPDPLEAALRAVPLTRIVTCVSGCHTEDGEPDYTAMVAVMREWWRKRMPPRRDGTSSWVDGYNGALADVARRLGL